MGLNNKGFAITGVLYGLLILFVILVGSYLAIMSSKKNRLDTISDELNEKYGFEKVKQIQTDAFPYTTEYAGKYTFVMTDSSGKEYSCISYLDKDQVISYSEDYTNYYQFSLSSISGFKFFTDAYCNDYNDDYGLPGTFNYLLVNYNGDDTSE